MKIECPSCQAIYEVADSAIGETGRNLRCAACGHYWFQKPESNSNADAAASPQIKVIKETRNRNKAKNEEPKTKLPPHLKMRQKQFEKMKFSQIAAIAIGWIGALAVFIGIIFMLIANRVVIVNKWPKSASFFSALGAPVNLYGLEIKNTEVRSGVDAEGNRLLVQGKIINISKAAKLLPYIRVNLIDTHGKTAATWLIDPHATVIEAGQSLDFQSIRRNPPQGDFRVILAFAEAPKELKAENMDLKPTAESEHAPKAEIAGSSENSLLLGGGDGNPHANEANKTETGAQTEVTTPNAAHEPANSEHEAAPTTEQNHEPAPAAHEAESHH